jgi:hypothetical protein
MLPPAASLVNVSEICAHKRSYHENDVFRLGGMKNAHTRPARKTFHFERTRRFGEQVEVLIVRG